MYKDLERAFLLEKADPEYCLAMKIPILSRDLSSVKQQRWFESGRAFLHDIYLTTLADNLTLLKLPIMHPYLPLTICCIV